MQHGGKRPGAGRPRGSTDHAIAEFLPVIDGLTPLEFLLRVVAAPEAPLQVRIEAAKAAAPYCHQKLAPKKADDEEKPTVSPEEASWSEMLGSRAN